MEARRRSPVDEPDLARGSGYVKPIFLYVQTKVLENPVNHLSLFVSTAFMFLR